MDNNRKKSGRKMKVSRRGVIMIALIAALVLLINLITASYSWFEPKNSDTKSSLSYTNDDPINTRSENCAAPVTYTGTKLTSSMARYDGEYINQIRYSSAHSDSVPLTAGTTAYFKTQIVNNNVNYGTDISLYIKNMPAGTVAVTYPSNTVRKIASARNDYPLIRNAYVKKYVSTDVNGPGLLEVEWFIIPTESGTLDLTSSNLYIMYN